MGNTDLMDPVGAAIGPGLDRAPTGISGLDQITGGGLPRGRVTLIAGSAGAGKTIQETFLARSGQSSHGDRTGSRTVGSGIHDWPIFAGRSWIIVGRPRRTV